MRKRITTFAMLSPVALAGYFWMMAPPPVTPTVDPTRPPLVAPPPAPRHDRVRIYVLSAEAGEPALQAQWVPVARGGNPIARTLDYLTLRSDSPLPEGTRVRRVRLDARGILHLDLNAAFVKNFPGGSTPESLAVRALCQSVAEFPGVMHLKITVMGKPIATLGGHLDLTRPLPVR